MEYIDGADLEEILCRLRRSAARLLFPFGALLHFLSELTHILESLSWPGGALRLSLQRPRRQRTARRSRCSTGKVAQRTRTCCPKNIEEELFASEGEFLSEGLLWGSQEVWATLALGSTREGFFSGRAFSGSGGALFDGIGEL